MSTDHPDDPRAHAACAALRTLARLLASGLPAPELGIRYTGTATDDAASWQVTVILTRWDGPPQLHPVTFAPASSPPLPMPLRDVEVAALEAAPLADGRPVSIRQLARLAGYKDSGHFREAVAQLIDRGLLVRIRGGVRRARLQGEPH